MSERSERAIDTAGLPLMPHVHSMKRYPRRAIAACAVLVTVTATACSAGLDSVPLPAPSVGPHAYTLTATFANALNLPTKAKVRVDGADVGEVESMRARDYAAVVAMRIRSGTVLPAGTTAQLRSATPMGDVFIALTPPVNSAPGAAALHDGDSIAEPSTSAAATIEEVLTRAALLVNGGAIRDLTKVINGAGAEFAGRGDHLAELIAETTTLVQTLAARSDQIRSAVRDAGTLTATVAAQQQTVNAAVAAAGPALDTLGSNTHTLVDLTDRLGRISQQLQRFPSVNGTGKRSLIADMNSLAAGMNAASVDPNSDIGALDRIIGIVAGKVASSTGGAGDVDVHQIVLGAVPDPNFPGSPAARIPDLTDWANFVGSLAYTLHRLHDRVIGPGR